MINANESICGITIYIDGPAEPAVATNSTKEPFNNLGYQVHLITSCEQQKTGNENI